MKSPKRIGYNKNKHWPGQIVQMFTLIEFVRIPGMWKARCECGTVKIISLPAVSLNGTRSCGCLNKKLCSIRGRAKGVQIIDGKKICLQCNKNLSIDNFRVGKRYDDEYEKKTSRCNQCLWLNSLVRKFNKPLEYITFLFEKANGNCQCCGSNNDGKTLFLDHDHTTGEIRNFLCLACNTTLGHVKENINTLNNMKNYLIKYNAESL